MSYRLFGGADFGIRFLCVCLGAGSALALSDVQTGANGSIPGQSGGNATASAVSTDAANLASATGGDAAGAPGSGGAAMATATNPGYDGTSPASVEALAAGGTVGFSSSVSQSNGRGGDAAATASGNASQASALTLHARATGGRGSENTNAPGGDGGNATVGATGTLGAVGLLTINVEAISGEGGSSRELLIPGGAPGAVLLNPIFGSSLGDGTITLAATGGNGGGISFPAGFSSIRGADGRSVELNNAIDGSAVGTLTLRQTATGGKAGAGFHATAGSAGSASSVLDKTANGGLQLLDLATFATGGDGSLSGTPAVLLSSPGGPGSATSRAANEGGRAVAAATAKGGTGDFPAAAMGGLASALASARGATLAGSGSTASAVATGGNSTGGNSAGTGTGGAAVAEASAETVGGGTTTVTANATGGSPPSNFLGFGGGGAATAGAAGTADAGSALSVTALATGGQGSFNLSGQSGGPATATAAGTSGGSAIILARAVAGASPQNTANAQATATGTAPSGLLTAEATTSRHRGYVGPVFTVQTIATAAPVAASSASAKAELGTANATFPPAGLTESLAIANASPTAAPVAAALSGNRTSASRFDSTVEAQRLLLGSLGAKAPATLAFALTSTARILVAVDLGMIAAADRKNLQLALFNPVLTGAGPDSVRLRALREGLVVHDVTLVGPAAARAYFTDRVLDFGSLAASVTGDLDVEIRLDVTAAQPGDGFYTSVFLGNAAAAPGQSMDQWRQVYFGAGATNSGLAADEANPSGDGLTNLLKFALGLNPLLPYPAGTAVVFDTTPGSLRLTVQRDPNASGVALSVEGTDDPSPAGSWSTNGTVVEQNTSTLLQVRDATPIQPGSRRMLRLRATRM